MKLRPAAAVFTFLSAGLLVSGKPDESAIKQQVAALLAQMTTDEKIGQLIQYSAPGEETGPATRRNLEAEVAAGRVGSILNAIGVMLAIFVHPYWIGINAFVSCGLMAAGSVGFCLMGRIMAVMPWNRPTPIRLEVSESSSQA